MQRLRDLGFNFKLDYGSVCLAESVPSIEEFSIRRCLPAIGSCCDCVRELP